MITCIAPVAPNKEGADRLTLRRAGMRPQLFHLPNQPIHPEVSAGQSARRIAVQFDSTAFHPPIRQTITKS
jgi:hypothetical protein